AAALDAPAVASPETREPDYRVAPGASALPHRVTPPGGASPSKIHWVLSARQTTPFVGLARTLFKHPPRRGASWQLVQSATICRPSFRLQLPGQASLSCFVDRISIAAKRISRPL